jgi:hypothetical protein
LSRCLREPLVFIAHFTGSRSCIQTTLHTRFPLVNCQTVGFEELGALFTFSQSDRVRRCPLRVGNRIDVQLSCFVGFRDLFARVKARIVRIGRILSLAVVHESLVTFKLFLELIPWVDKRLEVSKLHRVVRGRGAPGCS